MTPKPAKPARRPADRTVYELTPARSAAHQVEASTVPDLTARLRDTLRLDDLAARSAAHLLHHHGVTITGPAWSARPVGRLVYQPLTKASKEPQTPSPSVTPDPSPNASTRSQESQQ